MKISRGRSLGSRTSDVLWYELICLRMRMLCFVFFVLKTCNRLLISILCKGRNLILVRCVYVGLWWWDFIVTFMKEFIISYVVKSFKREASHLWNKRGGTSVVWAIVGWETRKGRPDRLRSVEEKHSSFVFPLRVEGE